MAAAPHGADADTDDEPAAGSGDERRSAAEEKAVERTRASPAGRTSVGSVGLAAAQRPARAAGSDEPQDLTRAIEREARRRSEAARLMTHPGVGPITALAFTLIIGTPQRFGCGKQIGSYVGLIPAEDSSAGHQRLGRITKQGSTLLRFLLVEAA